MRETPGRKLLRIGEDIPPQLDESYLLYTIRVDEALSLYYLNYLEEIYL